MVTSYASADQGAQPMEIDALTYKGEKGKGKSKSKGKKGDQSFKGKGKSKDGKGKQSPWQNSWGKGKSKDGKSGNNSDGKGKGGNVPKDVCTYCLKPGHWRRECRKLMADRASGRVRPVQYDDGASVADSSSTVPTSAGVSTAAQSTAVTMNAGASTSNVRRVECISTPVIEDLTALEQYPAAVCKSTSYRINAITCSQFDMACTDDDDNWVCSPYLDSDMHVCTLSSIPDSGDDFEILLDTEQTAVVFPSTLYMLAGPQAWKTLFITLMLREVLWAFKTLGWQKLHLAMFGSKRSSLLHQ